LPRAENLGREQMRKTRRHGSRMARVWRRDSAFVTPEFVRDEIARGRAIIPPISIIRNSSR